MRPAQIITSPKVGDNNLTAEALILQSLSLAEDHLSNYTEYNKQVLDLSQRIIQEEETLRERKYNIEKQILVDNADKFKNDASRKAAIAELERTSDLKDFEFGLRQLKFQRDQIERLAKDNFHFYQFYSNKAVTLSNLVRA